MYYQGRHSIAGSIIGKPPRRSSRQQSIARPQSKLRIRKHLLHPCLKRPQQTHPSILASRARCRSAQYGPAHIDASAGGQVQASLSQSETKAFVTATENVQRSVKEVSKIIVTAQTCRTVETDSTLEHHKLSNNDTTVTVGLYRWLSEVHRVQLWRYPNCLVLEFEIPEPGAWLRWAMLNAPTTMFNQDPGPFRLTGAANVSLTARFRRKHARADRHAMADLGVAYAPAGDDGVERQSDRRSQPEQGPGCRV